MVSNIFYFQPYLGKIPILTNIFQRGWNHQPGFKSTAKCLDRAFQLLEPIKNYVEDIRKRERILSNASITGEVNPNHAWNIREHELACARAASLVDGSRTARAIAWMNVQNKLCAPAVQVSDNLKLGDCSQHLYDWSFMYLSCLFILFHFHIHFLCTFLGISWNLLGVQDGASMQYIAVWCRLWFECKKNQRY